MIPNSIKLFAVSGKTFLAVGLVSKTLLIFEKNTDGRFVRFGGSEVNYTSAVSCLDFDPEKRHLYVALLRGSVYVYSVSASGQIRQVKKTSVAFYSMYDKSFCYLGKSLFGAASWGSNPSIKINFSKNKFHIFDHQHRTVYTSVAARHTKRVFTGSFDNSIVVVNQHSKKLWKRYADFHSNYVSVILLLDNDRTMVSTGYDNSVKVFDLEQQALVKTIKTLSMNYVLMWVADYSCMCVGGGVTEFLQIIYRKSGTSQSGEPEVESSA